MRHFVRNVCLLALALLAGASYAEPVARISGPTEAEPGNLVILRTEGSQGTGHRWAVLPPEAREHFIEIVDASTGQPAAVFSSAKPGSYTFVLIVAENGPIDWVAETVGPAQTAIATHTLVQGPPVPPGPGPARTRTGPDSTSGGAADRAHRARIGRVDAPLRAARDELA